MTIKEAIESSATMAEAARKMNMPFSTFKRKAGDLYQPNQSGKGTRKGRIYETSDILLGKHPHFGSTRLKERLISEKYLDNQCSFCGITDIYNGKPIVLQLDHINGVHNDNRLKNLRILCPNCHSQTETWCRRK